MLNSKFDLFAETSSSSDWSNSAGVDNSKKYVNNSGSSNNSTWYQNNFNAIKAEDDDTSSQRGDKKMVSSSPLPEYWCSISYFELDVQVGQSFKVKSSGHKTIYVDGYVEQNDRQRYS